MKPTPQWYKDAVIYQLHIKSFYDANGDGIGDFEGLRQKLDYLQDLGVNTIWMLPFYPSPLRDDGYDIADYYDVNPDYGTLEDFKAFLKAAHDRGLRVITELVINHTSDQHEWFQKARRAPAGSPERDMYVWSDTAEKYQDARIIFQDFETSNWSWDPVAKAYYWHRFYNHQPDLNFENPRVHEAIIEVLDFWLDLGVDGLRLDAIPYLYEREGTNCENLPETHQYLKTLRTYVDKNYPNRMLLAEANQWPEDSVEYFGDDDECHMSFHFPIMPRLYMSLFMEDRFPIIDILEQTPDIPEGAQWAMFLRNHDELTLEMVTDEERDYMYQVYAMDPRARINLGIRRRLAPLLRNDRRKIELLNFLLFSLPGTPIVYYGDEIGMGDNYFLGDRNGVRTPMQWGPDRNAGFSKANPQELFLPVILDPEYFYESLNVENQLRNESSLLWWMKRMINTRKQFEAFGRGDIQFLLPENPKVLTFLRKFKNEEILVVINLSKFAQVAEIELSHLEGKVPVDVFSGNRFPKIGRDPYRLTLGSYDYFWFEIEKDVDGAERKPYEPVEVKFTFDLSKEIAGKKKTKLENEVLPDYLSQKPWFNLQEKGLRKTEIIDQLMLSEQGHHFKILLIEATFTENDTARYCLPICIESRITDENRDGVLAGFHHKDRQYWLMEGYYQREFGQALLAAFTDQRALAGKNGKLSFHSNIESVDKHLNCTYKNKDRSKAIINFEQDFVAKIFYRLRHREHPEVEMMNWLHNHTKELPIPAYLGAANYRKDNNDHSVGILQNFVANQGTARVLVKDRLRQFFEELKVKRHEYQTAQPESKQLQESLDYYFLEMMERLGQTIGAVHAVLAESDLPKDKQPEAFSKLYQRSLYQAIRSRVRRSLAEIGKLKDKDLDTDVNYLNEKESDLLQLVERIAGDKMDILKIRIHGDLRLDRMLFTGNEFVWADFEGNIQQPVSERRIKGSALRDVAGIFFSIHVAIHQLLFFRKQHQGEEQDYLQQFIQPAKQILQDRFWVGYTAEVKGKKLVPTDQERDVLMTAFMIRQSFQYLTEDTGSWAVRLKIARAQIEELLG